MDYDRVLNEAIFDRMVEVGWIVRYAFQSGRGFAIEWTEEGKQKAGLLRAIVEYHNLTSSPHLPRHFDAVARGDWEWEGLEIAENIKFAWIELTNELGIERDGALTGVMALAHVAANYAPDVIGDPPPGWRS